MINDNMNTSCSLKIKDKFRYSNQYYQQRLSVITIYSG